MVNYKTHGLVLLGSFVALGSALGFAIFTVALRYSRAGDMLLSVFLLGIYAIWIMCGICALFDLKFC